MIKDLVRLVDVLNKNVSTLVDAIGLADPSTKEYAQLLENYSGTMTILSTTSRTLKEISVAAKEMEENKDESNN